MTDDELTTEQVLEIRASSERNRALADRFGVDIDTVSAIRRGESWKHLL